MKNALMTVKHSGPKATLQKSLASQPLKTRIHLQKNYAITAKFLLLDITVADRLLNHLLN